MNDLTLGFSYTAANQLAGQTSSNTAYDWPGPRSASTTTVAPDGLNRDAAIVALSSGYDANGNEGNNGSRMLTYDFDNRLTRVVIASSTTVTLAYDPTGRLQQQTTTVGANSTTTTFLYDGSRLSAEYNGATLLRRFVHGPGTDEPIAWYEGASNTDRRYLHADERGSLIAWSNGAGAVTAIQSYGPHGEPASWSGSRFAYTGQIMIPEVALYHYKARAYDPTTGRFMQTDPVGTAGG